MLSLENEITTNLYAIIDIETTGGKFNEEGITEIAIYKFDGHQITDKFVSLINPEKEIQPFVVNLTGINNAMLKNAPKFYEVAKRIVEITHDCVIVAHNAHFDNRILTTEFRRLGYEFSRKTLCTVELSQQLIPNKDSYKLGKLCRSLGIPIAGRHRAEGDAMATVQLFKLLLDKDFEKTIIKRAVKTENNRMLAPKLLTILDNLSSNTGLFYVHNSAASIMYIGKGKNIRKSVNELFLRSSAKALKIQDELKEITYEETGSQLIAHLKYAIEIRTNKPLFNSNRNGRYSNVKFSHDNLIIIDKGRNLGEKSVILIENNKLQGYAYTDLSYQHTNTNVLHSIISPIENSKENRFIVKKYLQKNSIEKLIRF